MSRILYLKFARNICTYHKTITLGEAGEMLCSDSAVVNRLKTENLYTFQTIRKGSHNCAARQVFSILEVVEKIHNIYPDLEIQNMGEPDFIVEYSTKPKENPAAAFLKVTVVCLICFFGAAFSIMTFNEDVATADLFRRVYMLMTGQESNGFTILELTYSLGLSVGILAFFNHTGKRSLIKEPTPIEVEMRLYEEDINTTLINTSSRNRTQNKGN